MPDVAIRINPAVSLLSKEGRVTWFVEYARLLESGKTIPQAARLAGISVSTLRKAVAAGRIVRNTDSAPAVPAETPSTTSQRSRQDAAAAQGIGTACTRAEERSAAAIGLAGGAATRFEPATDIALGGVLCGLPALCANGLFTGLDRHLSLPKGYYTAMHILCVLPFMALARIRRPEQLRHHQTAIITTARHLASPAIAGRMFSRWCQENYFGYMMEHYDIDGLIQYGSEEMDGTIRLVNPAWRDLDKQITRLTTQLRRHQAKRGAAPPPDPDDTKSLASTSLASQRTNVIDWFWQSVRLANQLKPHDDPA